MFPVAELPSSWYYKEDTPWGRNDVCRDIMIRPEPPLNREPSACPSGLVEFGSSIQQTCGVDARKRGSQILRPMWEHNAWRKEGYLLWKSWAVSYRGVEGPPWGHPRRISHVVPWSRCYYVKEHIERLLAPNMHLTLCSANVSSLSRNADNIRMNGCRTTINLK